MSNSGGNAAWLELPLARCLLPIYLVPREVTLHEMCEHLAHETVLGFDTETKPAFQRGERYAPAILQLASAHAIYIVQFKALRQLKPLQELLERPALKVGVGIGEDLRRLLPYFNLRSKNKGAQFIDLTLLAREKGLSAGSLRALCAELLGKRLSKAAQLTNWARAELSYSQLRYAALDACVSREIFLHLGPLGPQAPRTRDTLGPQGPRTRDTQSV